MSEPNQPEDPRLVEPWMQHVADKIRNGWIQGDILLEEIAEVIAEACPRFAVVTLPETHVAAPVHCPVCARPLKLNIPATIPFNSGKVSILAMPHKPATCQCGRVYVPFVTGAQLQCALAEIQPESLVVPATAMPRDA